MTWALLIGLWIGTALRWIGVGALLYVGWSLAAWIL